MNFQHLSTVPTPTEIIDVAFKAATKKSDKERENKFTAPEKKARALESVRIRAAQRAIHRQLTRILDAYPKVDELDPFYQAMIKLTIDYVALKKSFGAMKWADKQIGKLADAHVLKIHRARTSQDMGAHRRAFYGRANSTIAQIKKELRYLEEARKIMKSFPNVKTGIPTVVIAGYPNVGKTTLLKKLTGAQPKVASYPFTTQRLMMGYLNTGKDKIQLIDTPGMLDRPLSAQNQIERHSTLALKHVADHILFLLDASESCGYPVEKQKALLSHIKKQFTVPVTVILTKTDLESKPTGLRNTIKISQDADLKEVKKLLESLTP